MGNLPFAHRVALMLTEIQIEDVSSEEDLKIAYRDAHVLDFFHLNDVFNPLQWLVYHSLAACSYRVS